MSHHHTDESVQTGQLPAYCGQRAEDSSCTPEEQEAWGFMRVLLESEPRPHLLSHLNFDSAAIPKLPPTEAPAPAPAPAAQEELQLQDQQGEEVPQEVDPQFANPENNEISPFGAGESAFGDAIVQGSSDFAASVDTGGSMGAAEPCESTEPAVEDNGSRVLGIPAVATLVGHDEIVTRALIASDMETAVEACFATGATLIGTLAL